MALNDFYTALGVLALQDGYTDFLAIVRDTPTEPAYSVSIDAIAPTDVIPVSEFGLSVAQSSYAGAKYAGEGPDPQTVLVGQASVNATFSFPLLSPAYGWVDPPVAHLWHHALLAYRGTATAPWARVLNANTPPSTVSTLSVDNVADFIPMDVPFSAVIRTGSVDYDCVVVSVSKSSRQLTLSSAVAIPLDDSSTVRGVFDVPSSFTERGFSLVSMREGVLRPCLVKSMGIRMPSSGDAEVKCEVSACRLFRDQQPAIRDAYDPLAATLVTLPVSRRAMPASVAISGLSAPSWTFGLGSPINDPLLAGFQGLSLDPMVVTEVSVKIENKIVEINTLHGMQPSTASRDVQFPLALACESRVISGEIAYLSHIKPWALAERLSGMSTSGLNGIRLDMDSFRLNIPLVAWEPSGGQAQVDGYHERRVKWTCVADDYDNPPRLEFPT